MMDKRKVAWTLLAAVAVILAISGVADRAADGYAEDALKRALVTFAAARSLNGVISVAQSTELGVGVTVAVGQILDPVNDLVEQFSSVMLVAASSLGLQTLILRITSSQIVTVTMIVISILAVVALWLPRLQKNGIAQAASRILLIMLCVRFIVPLLIIGTNLVSDTFLAAGQAEATAALEVTGDSIEELKVDAETGSSDEQSILDRLGTMIDESMSSMNISERLAKLKENASNATEHIIDLIVLFVLQTIILPLALLWLFVQIVKGITARWTQY
jgi:hypothetical protein